MNSGDFSQALGTLLIAGAMGSAMYSMSAKASPESDARDVAAVINVNFTPVEQNHDRLRFHTGESPFTGDCDDHALAAYYQFWKRGIEPELVLVKAKDGTRHVLTCATGWCVDSNRLKVLGAPPVYPEDDLGRLYLKIIDRGQVSPEYAEENFHESP